MARVAMAGLTQSGAEEALACKKKTPPHKVSKIITLYNNFKEKSCLRFFSFIKFFDLKVRYSIGHIPNFRQNNFFSIFFVPSIACSRILFFIFHLLL